MAITKIQAGALPADVITTAAIDDASVTHAKLHTTMDLSSKTVTLPSAITDTITNKLPLAGGTMTGTLTGTNVDASGRVLVGTYGTPTTGTGFRTTSTDLYAQYNAVDTIRLNVNGSSWINSGNVGIGTSSPAYKLDIKDTSNNWSGARLYNDSTGSSARTYLQLGTDASQYAGWVGMNSTTNTANIGGASALVLNNGITGAPIILGTQSIERMRIRSDGNIHINSTTPDLVGSTTSLTIGGSSFGGDGMLSLQSGWGGATYGRLFASGGKLKIGNPQSNDIELYTANLTRMKIDASGRVTMPYQPAWNAAGSGWHTTTTAGVLPLASVVMNIGNHYSGTNYRFTAPVAGVYQVNTIFYMEATGQAVLKKNGADYAPVDTIITGFTNEGANSELTSASVCIYLSANDYIQVGARNGQTVRCYLGHTFFSGYLVG